MMLENENPKKFLRYFFVSLAVLSFFLSNSMTEAQVLPAEIKNPRLKALEQKYLSDLVELNRSISELKFPFKLSLNRQVGLDPKDQAGADLRGLEFVLFRDRELLKVTANYNAAYNSDALTSNQRAGRVLNEVVIPLLRLLPSHFGPSEGFDGFGFEIGYHVRTQKPSYGYEGKEILVIVFDKADALRYPALSDTATQQEVLNHSDIYVNGEPFGLALGASAPFEVEALIQRPAGKTATPVSNGRSSASTGGTANPAMAGPTPSPVEPPAKSAVPVPAVAAAKVNINIDGLREKYKSELDILSREGTAKFHFVDYAPPSFIMIRNQAALQATLHNPESFDKDSTSIYKRAARSFDLFLAPRLKWIVSKLPQTEEFSAVDISVINELTSARSEKSSEAIEFFFPLREARQFTAADITNQDLIDRSIVLVNGVRIALNLAQVE